MHTLSGTLPGFISPGLFNRPRQYCSRNVIKVLLYQAILFLHFGALAKKKACFAGNASAGLL
jgi:hypothetical protein